MKIRMMWRITSGYEKLGARLARLECDDLVSVLLHAGSALVPTVSEMVY